MANIFLCPWHVTIDDVNVNEYIATYTIRVKCDTTNWTVRRRFREFVDLNKKLATTGCAATFPPKKLFSTILTMFRPSFVEQRRDALDKYLKDVVAVAGRTLPYEAATFFDLHRYDINYIVLALARSLRAPINTDAPCHIKMRPLHVFAITQCLLHPQSLFLLDKDRSFAFVMDACYNASVLTVDGIAPVNSALPDKDGCYGTSNIPVNVLFDFLVFRNLKELHLHRVTIGDPSNLYSLKSTLTELRVIECQVTSVYQVLEWNRVDYEELLNLNHGRGMAATDADVIEPFEKWHLHTLDLSRNRLIMLDLGLMLIDRLEVLVLRHNQLRDLDCICRCQNLRELDLEDNCLVEFGVGFPKLERLNVSKNQLTKLYVYYMPALIAINASANRVSDISGIVSLGMLQNLQELQLTGNPLSTDHDYRKKVLGLFGARAFGLSLDWEATTEQEYARVAVHVSLNEEEGREQREA